MSDSTKLIYLDQDNIKKMVVFFGDKGDNINELFVTEANQEMDQRDFGVGAQILRDLKVRRIKLISSNPKKRIGLTGYNLEIVDYLTI